MTLKRMSEIIMLCVLYSTFHFILTLHRFSSVAKEVLAERIPSKAYDCYMLLCDAVQMLYSTQLQVTGWEDHHIERLEKLLWSHAIRAEEFMSFISVLKIWSIQSMLQKTLSATQVWTTTRVSCMNEQY